jgi:hypothetical protein
LVRNSPRNVTMLPTRASHVDSAQRSCTTEQGPRR